MLQVFDLNAFLFWKFLSMLWGGGKAVARLGADRESFSVHLDVFCFAKFPICLRVIGGARAQPFPLFLQIPSAQV